MLRRAPALQADDLVAVITPSSPVRTPQRLARGVAALEVLGWRVRTGPMASAVEFGDRSAAVRADEINQFLRDPSVRAIFVTLGGYNSNAILDRVDWAALRRDPKVVVGYSDVTGLLAGALTRAQVVPFHGPTVLPELGEFPEPFEYTVRHLRAAVARTAPIGRLRAAPRWTEQFLAWDSDDVRPRTTIAGTPWEWLAGGRATGPLLGGNLETLGRLAGTGYLPDFTGAVVLWETTATTIEQVEAGLAHLDMLGVFDVACGMLVGRSFRGGGDVEARLRALVRERYAGRGIPIVAGVDLGHTDPMVTLPLGVPVLLDSADDRVEVQGAGVG